MTRYEHTQIGHVIIWSLLFEKSVYRRAAETKSPEACATLLQLAEPAQRDRGLWIVDFVAAVEGADPDPLKSGAFD